MAFKLENIPNQNPNIEIGAKLESILKKEITFFKKGFSSKIKYMFYNELSVLLQAGINLKEALELIKDNQKKNNAKIIFEKVIENIVNGKSLSESILETKQFTEYEFYSIKIGEETGTLALVCNKLGVFFERKNEQKRIIISALTYPAIVLSTAFLVVFFMLNFVVPMFEEIFKQNRLALPLLTRMIIAFSNAIKSYSWLLMIIIVFLFILAKLFNKNNHFKEILHNFILKTPVFGAFMIKIYLAQFTQAMALLTTSKVPMLNSIQLIKNMIDFIPLQHALKKVEVNILKGASLSQSLSENKIFDNRIISLVKVAEETNQTEFVFNQLSEQYNNEVIRQSKMIATIIEPFIIIVVGIIVGVLLVALYLPMFQLSSVIG